MDVTPTSIVAEQAELPTADVLGVSVSTLDLEATVQRVDDFLRTESTHAIVTADSSGFVLAQSNDALLQLYKSADLVTADSAGVVWAVRKLTGQRISRVSGVDLAFQICRLASLKGYRVFLLGAQPGIADRAAERLRLQHPGIQIVGTRHGYFPVEDDELVAAEIAPLHPDVLLVAMGIPRQEMFISRTADIIRAKVSMGVGGSLDVFSGKVRRAPRLVRRLKLEWVWRLLQNPGKVRKVALLPRFVRLVLRYRR